MGRQSTRIRKQKVDPQHDYEAKKQKKTENQNSSVKAPTAGESPSKSSPRKKQLPVTETPQKEQLSLGQKLLTRREHDVLSDLIFVSNSSQEHFKAHLLVVREASSTLEDMINKRRRARVEQDDNIQINLPSDIGLDSVNLFITYIYTNDFGTVSIQDANFSLETLLQLLSLSNHFGIKDLYALCCNLTKQRLKADNCVEIFQTLLPLSENLVCDEAFELVLKNVDEFIAKEEFLEWHWMTWRILLNRVDKLVSVFKALKRWKDHDVSGRDEVFKRLVKCIGFRSFGAEAVVDTLEGTGILTQTEMVDLFVHFTGGQRIITVSSDTDLQSALDNATVGSRIRLEEGTFKGNFSITKNNIKLIGEGKKSIIKGRLIVDASFCEISEIKIIPEHLSSTEENVVVSSCSSISNTNALVFIKGDGNKFNNSIIAFQEESESSFPVCALSCTGNDNKIVGILSHISSFRILGDKNKIEAITFEKVKHGIVIEGDENLVSDILYFPKAPSPDVVHPLGGNNHHHQHHGLFSAINIYEGKSNFVVNLRYVQVSASDDDELVYMLSLGSGSKSTKVRNCSSGPVFIDGEGNEVINVKTRPRFHFKVMGKKHQLVNCGGEKFELHGKDVMMNDCTFY